MKHLKIGGSTIARTLQCPAWIQRTKFEVNKSGVAADIGNLLHDAMENHYKHNRTFLEQLGLKYKNQILTTEHLPILYSMKADVERVLRKFDAKIYKLEPFVQLITDVAGGSLDVLAVANRAAIIMDYKTGRVPVSAIDNKQLKFYALCAYYDHDTRDVMQVEEFHLCIIQPTAERTLSIETVTLIDLMKFEIEVQNAIEESSKENPKAMGGDQCEYCPAKNSCDEYRHRNLIDMPQNLANLLTSHF
jgi:hypothetical protein